MRSVRTTIHVTQMHPAGPTEANAQDRADLVRILRETADRIAAGACRDDKLGKLPAGGVFSLSLSVRFQGEA